MNVIIENIEQYFMAPNLGCPDDKLFNEFVELLDTVRHNMLMVQCYRPYSTPSVASNDQLLMHMNPKYSAWKPYHLSTVDDYWLIDYDKEQKVLWIIMPESNSDSGTRICLCASSGWTEEFLIHAARVAARYVVNVAARSMECPIVFDGELHSSYYYYAVHEAARMIIWDVTVSDLESREFAVFGFSKTDDWKYLVLPVVYQEDEEHIMASMCLETLC